jgi:uncharacterized membrane protein
MSSDIIVLVFPSRAVLTKALDRMATLDYVDMKRAAIIAKADGGEITVLDDDISPNQGGIAGGTFGAAMGIWGFVQLGALALPGVGAIIALGAGALVGAAVGRVTGRLAANLVDFGFRPEHVKGLAERLQAGHPALMMEIKNRDWALSRLHEDLRPYRFEVLETPVPAGV